MNIFPKIYNLLRKKINGSPHYMKFPPPPQYEFLPKKYEFSPKKYESFPKKYELLPKKYELLPKQYEFARPPPPNSFLSKKK